MVIGTPGNTVGYNLILTKKIAFENVDGMKLKNIN